jgi:hypothetical protein
VVDRGDLLKDASRIVRAGRLVANFEDRAWASPTRGAHVKKKRVLVLVKRTSKMASRSSSEQHDEQLTRLCYIRHEGMRCDPRETSARDQSEPGLRSRSLVERTFSAVFAAVPAPHSQGGQLIRGHVEYDGNARGVAQRRRRTARSIGAEIAPRESVGFFARQKRQGVEGTPTSALDALLSARQKLLACKCVDSNVITIAASFNEALLLRVIGCIPALHPSSASCTGAGCRRRSALAPLISPPQIHRAQRSGGSSPLTSPKIQVVREPLSTSALLARDVQNHTWPVDDGGTVVLRSKMRNAKLFSMHHIMQ